MELDQKLVDLIEGIITVKQQEAYKQGFLHGKAGEAKSDKYVYYTRNSGIDKDQSDHYIKGYEHGMREKENPHKKDAEDHEAWREKTAAARKGRYYHESVEDTNYYVARKAVNNEEVLDVVNKKFTSPVKAYDEADRHKIRLRNQMKEGLEESIKQGGSSQPKQRDYVIHFERDEPFNVPNPSKVMDSIELPGHSKEHVRFKFDNLVKEGDVSGVKVKHIMRKYN